MNIKRKIVLGSFLAITVLVSPIAARAGVTIEIGGPPIFYPAPDFQYDRGYYRTYDHHYYHYEADRSGWYYGRNHEEGLREEKRRAKHHHHDNGNHNGWYKN